jgi:hypothetical protein
VVKKLEEGAFYMDRTIEPDYIKIYGMEPYPATSYPNEPFYRSPNCNLVHHGCMTLEKGIDAQDVSPYVMLKAICIRTQYNRLPV